MPKEDSSETVMKSAVVTPEFELPLTDTEVLNLKVPVQYFEYNPDYFSSASDNLDSEWQIKPKILLKTTRFQGHSLALGTFVSAYGFHADNVFWGFDPENSTPSEVDVNWVETSLLMEDTYQISRNVTLFAGLRYDRFHLQRFDFAEKSTDTLIKDNTMEATTPRLGVTWNLSNSQTLKLIYQEGYHFPDYINYLIYGDKDQSTGTEKIKSYEAGYSLNFLENRFSFNLDCYYNTQEESVNFSPPSEDTQSSDPIGERILTEKLTSIGFETGLRFIPDDTIQMELSYSFSRPYNSDDTPSINRFVDDSGLHWMAYPEHTVKFNLNQRMLDGRLNVSLGCLYNGPVKTASSFHHENENDLFDHHRFVVNAGIRYRFTENLSLIFRAKNIFNNDVPAAGYYYESMNRNDSSLEARVYALGLIWNF